MWLKTIVVCGLLVASCHSTLRQEAYATTDELIEMYGYPAETHEITTEDGYVLTVHRIPSSPRCTNNNSTKPVIVQHGNICSSANWVYMGKDHSLGFYLADNCFDVWLPNSRGNRYSKKHTKLSITDKKFWDFDWHEMGVYDTTAEIDYILSKTGHKAVYFIGHSQGTTQFAAFAAERAEYSSKVKLAMLMGPGVYMDHCKSPPMVMGAAGEAMAQMQYNNVGASEMMPHSIATTEYGLLYCTDATPLTQAGCAASQFYSAGTDKEQLNYTRLPVIYGHDPAGASSRQALHYYQIMNSGEFRKFDYGSASRNEEHYGESTPPLYDMNRIEIPISIHYALNDLITTPADADHLAENLPPGVLVGMYEAPFAKFNHLDYMYAIDAIDIVYKYLVDLMNDPRFQ